MSSTSDGLSDDYYAVLNVPKEASADELKNSYRRLCVLYHPDKHQDEERQTLAKDLFPRIQTAYAVLSDPQKRALYDIYGSAGVNAGYDLAPYYGTTAELRAEFEMQQRRQEEEKRLSMANATVNMEVTIDATQVFAPALEEDEERQGLLSILQDIEVSSMSAQQSIETPLSEYNHLRLTGALYASNGRGAGSLTTTLHHQHSGDWFSEAAFTMGSNHTVSLKTQRALGPKMQIALESSAQIVSTPLGLGFGPSLSAVLYRNLSMHTYGSLKYALTPRESKMVTSLVYHTEQLHASTSVQFGNPKSFVSMTFKRAVSESTKLRLSVKLGLDGFGLTYGVERNISDRDRIAMSLSMDALDGVTLKLKYVRLHQTYMLPVMLSDDFLPEAVVYGTFVPALLYLAVHRFWLQPMAAQQQQAKKMEARRRNRALIAERRREAHAAIQLMQETVSRKIEAEEAVGGLIIDEALYGELVAAADRPDDDAAVINVTVPLQCLVKDSQLITSAYSKSGLVGFYDPIPDEPKQLRVRYRFQGRPHQVTVDDRDELRIPRKADLLPE